jgi:hypothetical protein
MSLYSMSENQLKKSETILMRILKRIHQIIKIADRLFNFVCVKENDRK